MTEREVSSARESEERCLEIADGLAAMSEMPVFAQGHRSILLTAAAALRSSVKTVGVKSLVDFLWQEFCELPDRSSPEDYPDMALVSLPELTAIIETYLERSAIEAPAAPSEVTERDALLDYILQDDLHNRLTPRIVDIAYTAFTLAKAPNDEDGGPSDWFTDTKPLVNKMIEKVRADLTAALKGDRP